MLLMKHCSAIPEIGGRVSLKVNISAAFINAIGHAYLFIM